jgi:hypothetical protein
MSKWESRQRKEDAERACIKKSGRSVFLIVRLQVERAQGTRKIHRKRKK